MKKISSALLVLMLATTVVGLSGCGSPAPPDDVGVCWHMVIQKNGKVRFNRLADKVANMETCAMRLEVMRLQFLRVGGSRHEIEGAYQGSFLWLQREGVFVSQTLDGNRYPALKRMPDGSLAVPSAVAVP